MTEPLHLATCTVWVSANTDDCDCLLDRGWVVRKDPSLTLHQWRIYRRTTDNDLVPLMRCSSFAAAFAMVGALIDARFHDLRGDNHVR
jgi:hypothetical protein